MNITTYKSIMKNNPSLKALSPQARANALHITVRTLQRIENPNWKPLDEYAHDLERENSRLKKIIDLAIDTPKNKAVSYDQNLDNYTVAEQNAPEEGTSMAKDRLRYPVGRDENGKFIAKQVKGNNDCERVLAAVDQMFGCGFLQKERPGWFVTPVTVQSKPEKERILISEFVWDRWFNPLIKGKKSDNYEYQLEKRLEKIVAYFEGVYMDELSEKNVQAFFDERQHLAHQTLMDFRNSMKNFTGYAIEKKVMDEISWKRIKVGGHKKKSRKSGTVEQHMDIIAHLSEIADPVEQLAVAILAYTGIRPEEVIALRWEDVNFDEKRIYICRAIVFPGKNKEGKKSGHAILKGTKTEASEDWIPVADGLYDILMKHRQDKGWIVHDSNGGYFETYNRWQAFWKKASKSINLYGLRVCEFRKTIASVLSALHVDPKSIQRLLRHTTVELTMNTYAEFDEDTFIAGCNRIGNATM